MVQDLGYTAAFPLLINVSDQPTYFMALMDTEMVNQKFAMINVEKYNTIKVVGDSLADCLQLYLKALTNAGIKTDIDINDIDDTDSNGSAAANKTATGLITEIRSAVLNGESCYYFRLAGSDVFYSISAAKAEEAVILNKGDNVTITYKATTKSKRIVPAISIASAAEETTETATAAS